MSLGGQMFVILGSYALALMFIRGFLYGVKRYQLNNSAYKKRKRQESFKEWLFYSRYKEEIPKILRILYFVVLIIHPVAIIACLFVYLIKVPWNIGGKIATGIMIFDDVWVILIGLRFWRPEPDFAFERWIKKTRGQKPKKK